MREKEDTVEMMKHSNTQIIYVVLTLTAHTLRQIQFIKHKKLKQEEKGATEDEMAGWLQ